MKTKKQDLFVEQPPEDVQKGIAVSLVTLPTVNEQSFIVFLKFYDPRSKRLRYLGYSIVPSGSEKLEILRGVVNGLVGRREKDPLDVYEEMTKSKIKARSWDKTFEDEGISSGDILICQLPPIKVTDAPETGQDLTIVEFLKNTGGETPKDFEGPVWLTDMTVIDEMIREAQTKLQEAVEAEKKPEKVLTFKEKKREKRLARRKRYEQKKKYEAAEAAPEFDPESGQLLTPKDPSLLLKKRKPSKAAKRAMSRKGRKVVAKKTDRQNKRKMEKGLKVLWKAQAKHRAAREKSEKKARKRGF